MPRPKEKFLHQQSGAAPQVPPAPLHPHLPLSDCTRKNSDTLCDHCKSVQQSQSMVRLDGLNCHASNRSPPPEGVVLSPLCNSSPLLVPPAFFHFPSMSPRLPRGLFACLIYTNNNFVRGKSRTVATLLPPAPCPPSAAGGTKVHAAIAQLFHVLGRTELLTTHLPASCSCHLLVPGSTSRQQTHGKPTRRVLCSHRPC